MERQGFRALHLYNTQLNWEIPPVLGNLSNLIWLNLSGNQLSGQIPPELGNLERLQRLNIDGNPLSGCVPDKLRDQLDGYSGLGDLPFC